MTDNKKPLWLIIIFVVFLMSVSLWTVLIKLTKKTTSSTNKTPVFNYTNGKPDSTILNPDSLTVKNKFPISGPPYFSEELAQVGELHWQLRYFQPVIKSVVEKEGGLFLEVQYENMSNKSKNILVFVGGILEGKTYPYAFTEQNGQFPRLNSKQTIESLIDLNSRYRIDYLQTADNIDEALKLDICAVRQANVCPIGEYVNKHQDEYLKFYETGKISNGIYIMALSLKKDLYDK